MNSNNNSSSSKNNNNIGGQQNAGSGTSGEEEELSEEQQIEGDTLDRRLRCEASIERVAREIARDFAKSQPYHPPPELTLTEKELDYCWNIREQIDRNGGLTTEDDGTGGNPDISYWPIQSLTDYEIAQFAVILKDDTEKAIEQIEGLRRFKITYRVTDTVEQGLETIQEYIRILPGVLLSLDVTEESGDGGSSSSMMLAFDMSKFFPATARESEENFRTFVLFWYYITQICCAPNFDVLRGGTQMLVDVATYSMQNMDLVLRQQLISELLVHVPIKHNEIRIYNSHPVVNGFVNLVKTFMPREMRDAVSVGCQIQVSDPTASSPNSTNKFLNSLLRPPSLMLPSLFLQPNEHVAMQNLVLKVRTLLQERYQNERSFLLYRSGDNDEKDNAGPHRKKSRHTTQLK